MRFRGRLWTASVIALIVALAAWTISRMRSHDDLHLLEAEIFLVEMEETIPATALFRSGTPDYVCSIGPYFEAGFARNQPDRELLAELDLFPVPESDGLFVYFTAPEGRPAIDRLHLYSGRLRWRADENATRCLPVDRAAYKITKQDDHWNISLVQLE